MSGEKPDILRDKLWHRIWWSVNTLPIAPENFMVDSFGKLIGECKTFYSTNTTCDYVADFFVEKSDYVKTFEDIKIESLGEGLLRVIFFYSKGGRDYFDGVNIGRIEADKIVVQRVH